MNSINTLTTIDGFEISATHTVGSSNAIVLWLHGITVNKDEYLDFFKDGATHLESKGIDSLRIDFRGHGKSSGTSLDFSVVGQMLDIEASIEYLASRYDLDQKGIHIVACSFGAPPAIFAALLHSDIVRSITLIAPVLSYVRTFLAPETSWAQSIFNNETFALLQKTNKIYVNNEFPISGRLVEEMRIIDPEDALRKITQRVVLIHGDSDTMVPYAVSRNISREVQQIKLITFTNMDHGFTDVNDDIGDSTESIKNKNRIYEIIEESCRWKV